MEYLQYTIGDIKPGVNVKVLNLIINGIPSIPATCPDMKLPLSGFKPYYKWNTFNTINDTKTAYYTNRVLNLIINGIPSILHKVYKPRCRILLSFKPYYKWNTFNTI